MGNVTSEGCISCTAVHDCGAESADSQTEHCIYVTGRACVRVRNLNLTLHPSSRCLRLAALKPYH